MMLSRRLTKIQSKRICSLKRGNGFGLEQTNTRLSSTLSCKYDPQTNKPSLFSLSNVALHRLSQQRYMGRKDGNKAFNKVRPPTRKQKKKYHRRMREIQHHRVGRHSKPGSKAGPRREFLQNEFDFLVDSAKGKIPREPTPEELEYNFGDALVDDLIGNSSHLMSTPTPKPIYLGRQHGKHHNRIKQMMDDYREHLKLIESSEVDTVKDLVNIPSLPSDKQIALLLRSYRDKKSTKSNPIGIAKALQYLIKEIGVPIALFGQKTYTALVSCSANATEARRIMKMMEENGQSIDSYIYSILIDIHAKRGDFRAANSVLTEMRMEDVQPTLPAYTSLLAACYKAINKASIPQQIKAEAGNLAWEKWKELQINGMEPDVMAYGAIIRVFAARGLAERAINIVEEMQMREIKPTTLIFSSALRAIARSHARALRFEGGKSKRNKHREITTSYHGRMARNVVIMAEQIGVEQDDGYIQALMLCAATAGDSSTVKAIYLANEVRKIEDLRTIGGPEHLQLLRGKIPPDPRDEKMALESGVDLPEISRAQDEDGIEVVTGFDSLRKTRSKHGKRRSHDTRILSALLKANANALENQGLGNMWAGHENKGYLCENSLRLMQLRYTPKYIDKSIPGIHSKDSMIWDDEDVENMGKRLRRKKFMGLIDDSVDNEFSDFDPTIHRMALHDEDDNPDDFDTSAERVPQEKRYDDSHCRKAPSETEDDLSVNEAHNSTESMTITMGASDSSHNSFKGETTGQEGSEPQQKDVPLTTMQASDVKLGNNFELTDMDGTGRNGEHDLHNDLKPLSKEKESEDNLLLSLLGENPDELDLVLCGMPQRRIEQVREEFKANLGAPSMIRLVPILRENMPELISKAWLVDKNLRDAFVVMNKAEKDKVVDIHIMNSMLQVLAKSNKIEETLQFYDGFKKRNMRQNSVSDRTVFQMLVDRNQISRALEFKENKVEKKGQHIDLLSYGSLIEYYGEKKQLGSAIMSIKECIKVHGSPPSENSLSKIRLLCRQKEITKESGLQELVGDDPLEWLRKGESTYKREYSKKGNAQINMARNRLVDI